MKVSIKQKMALYFLFSLVIPMLIFSVYIPRTTRNLVYDERKGMLENNMDIVFSQLEVVNEDYKNGKFNTIDDAKQQAAHIISSYRYGSDEKDYFWIQENIEGNATMVMHPYLSNLNRTDVSNYKDQSGNRIFSQAQDICNKKDDTPGEGYLTYYWAYYKNANQTKQKMSFVKSFEDWGWIVGTGVYINDVETLISRKITNQMLLFILPTIIISLGLGYFVFHDLEKKNKFETNLQEEKENLNAILTNISDGVIITDNKLQIINMNKYAEELLLWNHNSNEKKKLLVNFPLHRTFTDKRTTMNNLIQRAKKGVFRGQYHLKTKKNEDRDIMLTILPVKQLNAFQIESNPDKGSSIQEINQIANNPEKYVIIFQDLTKQRELEKQYYKKHKIESLRVLAGGVAHDFNNTLMILMGNIDLLLLEEDISPEVKINLEQMKKEISQASGLTTQLVNFSKSQKSFRTEPTDVGLILKESAGLALKGTQSKLKINISENLPEVEINESQIRQVFNNLVINANEAMKPYGGIIEINCDALTNPNNPENPLKYPCVHISIKDSGKGIPEDLREKIFDPYFTTKKDGNGLGLATSKLIIDQLDGKMRFQSKKGVGTTFHLYLPIIVTMDEKRKTDFKLINLESNQNRKLNCLVLDDRQEIRRILRKKLNKMSITVDLAETPEEAINKYLDRFSQNSPYDFVILDLINPGEMGGIETLKRIKEFDENVRAIIMSGYTSEPAIVNPKEYGFIGSLKKPFNTNKLIKIIYTAVD